MIYKFTAFIDSAVGCYGPNWVTSTTLIRTWYPCAMTMLTGREKPSGTTIMAASAREGTAPPAAMT